MPNEQQTITVSPDEVSAPVSRRQITLLDKSLQDKGTLTVSPDEVSAPVVTARPNEVAPRTLSLTPAPSRGEVPALISGESKFLKLLDVLNTPQQMLFGILTRQQGESKQAAAERGARHNLRFRDVIESTAEGRSLAKGFSGMAALETGAKPEQAEAAVGLAGDIVLDPLNLVPGKVLAAPLTLTTKVVGMGLKTLAKVPAVARTLEKVEPLIKPVAQAFSKTAFRTSQERRVIELADLAEIQFSNARTDVLGKAIEREKAVKQAAQQAGVPVDDAKKIIASLVEEKTIPAPKQLSLLKGEPPVEDTIAQAARQEREFDAQAQAGAQMLAQPPQTVAQTAGRTARQARLPFENQQSVGQAIQDVRDSVAELRGAAPDPLRQQALRIKGELEDVLLADQRIGLPISGLEDAQIDYLTHLLTPEARKAVAELPQFKALGRQFSPAHASQISRELRGLSVREINELAARGALPGFEGQVFKKFMVEDPVALQAVRELRSAKASADLDLLNRATVELGVPAGTAPAHYQPLAITRSTDPRLAGIGERFKGFVFEPEVAGHLNKAMETGLLPQELGKFLRVFDAVQGAWKAVTLSVFPSYHTRNAVGNVWNNYLAGLNNPLWYEQALKFQTGLGKEGGTVVSFTLGKKTYSRDELAQVMMDFGVMNRGFIAAEVPQEVRSFGKIGGGAQSLPGIKQGFLVGTAIENNARAAHFMWRLDKGDTPLQAARSVKKYLFDYVTGLTPFEKSTMRRIFPFYSWTRFNIPLQAQALVNNPRPFIRLAEVERTVRSDNPEVNLDSFQREVLPDFIRESSGIPTRYDENGNPEYFLLGGWLPAGDLETLGRPDGPLDKAYNLLSPFIRIPFEQATGYDRFLQREIEKFPGERQKLLGLDVRRRLVHASKIIRLFGEVDALTRGAQEKELTEDELTRLGKVTRALFGLKSFTVDVPARLRLLKFERQDLQRKRRSLLRRGEEGQVAPIDEILYEGNEE